MNSLDELYMSYNQSRETVEISLYRDKSCIVPKLDSVNMYINKNI